MKYDFTKSNIEKAIHEFKENPNFIYTALPRIKILYSIQSKIHSDSELKWLFEYNYVHVNTNRIQIWYDTTDHFTFYFEIPLTQHFELRVFFAKSSVHFLEIYNFLLQEKMIEKSEFPVKATSRTVPHFVINSKTKRYNTGIINKNSQVTIFNEDYIDEKICSELQQGFQLFIPIFQKIANEFEL